MAEETHTHETSEKHEKKDEKPGSGMLKKLLIFGVPAFLLQLVLLYFLTAKFVVPMTVQGQLVKMDKHGLKDVSGKGGEAAEEEHSEGDAKTPFIYAVKDLIVNPAGTNGQRYLLTTIAFNVNNEESQKEMETKDIAVRDMLNSVLTSKTMEQLIDVAQREALRQEIHKRAIELVTSGKVKSVYFSKYVVQ